MLKTVKHKVPQYNVMKKIPLVLLILALVVYPLNLLGVDKAYATAETDFEYILRPNGAGIMITNYKGTSKDVVVPKRIDGHKVVELFMYSFLSKDLNSIVLPEGLQKIDKLALMDNNLTTIVIPSTVTEMDVSALLANSLRTVYVKNPNMTYVDIPYEEMHLDDDFWGQAVRPYDRQIYDKARFREMGEEGFELNDPQVLAQIIPANETTLYSRNGSTTEPIAIRDGHVFSVSDFTEEEAQNNDSDYKYTVNTTTNTVTITGYVGISKDVVIPRKIENKPVTKIGSNAFWIMDLTSVVIHDGIEEIGTGAFVYNKLETVTIPSSVKKVGMMAFSNNYLQTIYVMNPTVNFNVGIFEEQHYDNERNTDGTHRNPIAPQDIKIYGHTGSTSENLATTEGLKFIPLGTSEEEPTTPTEPTEPTIPTEPLNGEQVGMQVLGGTLTNSIQLISNSSLYLDYAKSKVLNFNGDIEIEDNRGSGEGWTTTVAFAPFTKTNVDDPTSTLPTDTIDVEVETATLEVDLYDLESKDGLDLTGMEIDSPTVYPTIGGDSVRILNADKGKGMGTYGLKMDITLNLGKGLVKVTKINGTGSKLTEGTSIGLVSGEYTSKVIVTTGTGL